MELRKINNPKKKYKNYNILFLCKDFRFYYFFFLFLFLLTFDYNKNWHFFSKIIEFDSWSVYGDLRLLLKGIDVYRDGKNPFLENYLPPYNYPSTWKIFSYFKFINSDNYKVIVTVLILTSQFLFLSISGSWMTLKKTLYYLLLLISPLSLLMMERCNSDLVIFSLVTAPIVFFPQKKIAFIIFIFFAFLLKLYPLGAFLLAIYNFSYSKKIIIIYGFIFIITLLYIGINYGEFAIIKERTPTSIYNLSFGISVLTENMIIVKHLNKPFSYALTFFYILVLGITLFILFMKQKAKNTDLIIKLGNKEMNSFLIGSGIFLFSFFFTISWEYRLFFLLLCVPSILEWRKQKVFGTTFLIISLPIVFWNQTLRMIMEKYIYENSNNLFLFNQILIYCVAGILITYILIIFQNKLKFTKRIE